MHDLNAQFCARDLISGILSQSRSTISRGKSVERCILISKMGKKRKVGGPSFAKTNNGIELEDNSKLRIDTYDDVADSEDDFHINRDKILFEEGPAQKRQRKAREQGMELQKSQICMMKF